MSRINRVLVLGALLVMCSALTAQAYLDYPGGVRLMTLAGGSGLGMHVWNDSEEVFEYPGSLPTYANMFTWSFSPGNDGYSFTLNKGEETFGNYFIGLHRGDMGAAEWNNVTLGYGYSLEAADIGIIYNRQGISATTGGTETSESWNHIGLGANMEISDSSDLDLAFYFRSTSADDGTTETDGSGFGLMGRMFYAWTDDVTVIPVIGWSSAEYVEGVTDTDIMVGVAFAYVVNESNDVVFGLSYASNKLEDTNVDPDTENTVKDLPAWYLGAEHEFTDWFTVRGGASKAWRTTEMDSDNDQNSAPFDFTLGAGIAMGDWQLDLYLEQSTLYNWGYWFHGNRASSAPVAGIQAKLFF